jgi:predicted DNA-binding antitoxin AbrB/MazE fold protein
MEKTFEAVYEHGVLRPLEVLRLPDNAHVMVTITDVAGNGHELADYFTTEEWAAAANDQISLNEVRQALSLIPGSLADTVAATCLDRY